MHKHPPMVKNALHPDDIIGLEFKHKFKEHFKRTYMCQSTDDHERICKSIPDDVREHISVLWQEIRDNGWRAFGVDKYGDIDWRYVVDTRPKAMRDLDNEGK